MKPTSPASADLLVRRQPGPHHTELVELRDFLDVHLGTLPAKQRATLMAWAAGSSVAEIAAGEGVARQSVQERLTSALGTLRRVAGVGLAA